MTQKRDSRLSSGGHQRRNWAAYKRVQRAAIAENHGEAELKQRRRLEKQRQRLRSRPLPIVFAKPDGQVRVSGFRCSFPSIQDAETHLDATTVNVDALESLHALRMAARGVPLGLYTSQEMTAYAAHLWLFVAGRFVAYPFEHPLLSAASRCVHRLVCTNVPSLSTHSALDSLQIFASLVALPPIPRIFSSEVRVDERLERQILRDAAGAVAHHIITSGIKHELLRRFVRAWGGEARSDYILQCVPPNPSRHLRRLLRDAQRVLREFCMPGDSQQAEPHPIEALNHYSAPEAYDGV